MFAGWENLSAAAGQRRQPTGSAGLDFGAVKLRLIGSIAAIAAIQILETFVHIDQTRRPRRCGSLRSCSASASGVLLALMDRLAGHRE